MSDCCTTLPLWTGLQNVIQKYLESYTLADLKGEHNTQFFCNPS